MPAVPSLLEFSRQAVSRTLEHFVVRGAALEGAATTSERFASHAPGYSGPLTVVDATCGNGHDTLFMAQTLDHLTKTQLLAWRVLSFDVQAAALENARARLAEAGLADRAALIRDGHEHLARHLAAYAPLRAAECFEVAAQEAANQRRSGNMTERHEEESATERHEAANCLVRPVIFMYNLGFLPGSDKQVVTRAETTLVSLAAAVEALAPGGLLSVHAYGGHLGGLEELRAVDDWFRGLDSGMADAACYEFRNKARNPEALFLAVKK